MRPGKLSIRITILVLFAAILAYFGVYAWRSLAGGISTTVLREQTMDEEITVTGWFFRDEVLLSDTGNLTEVLCADGERITRGDVIARIYSGTEDYELQQELDAAQAELENLQYLLSRSGEYSDLGALDDNIVSAFIAMKGAVSAGDLSDLSAEADELRTLVFRRDYTYSGSDSLSEQVEQAQANVASLESRAGNTFTAVTAPETGLFSSVTDGYEGVMTRDALEGLTPGRLASLAGAQNESVSALGKLITNNDWAFACNVAADEAETLSEGGEIELRFADSGRDYTATISQISDADDGVVTIVFTSSDYAAQLVSLRTQSVEIILDRDTGFQVPKRAIRINDEGETGVYRISGIRAEWQPVEILREDGDSYLIAQETPDLQSAFDEATALREGDTVIVRGRNLYDGKVIDE